MSKYTVHLSGLRFGFDDGTNAINFLEMAESHFIPGTYVKGLDAEIRVKNTEVEDAKEESNDD